MIVRSLLVRNARLSAPVTAAIIWPLIPCSLRNEEDAPANTWLRSSMTNLQAIANLASGSQAAFHRQTSQRSSTVQSTDNHLPRAGTMPSALERKEPKTGSRSAELNFSAD